MPLRTPPPAEQLLIHTPFGRDGSLIRDFLCRAGIASQICSHFTDLVAAVAEGAGAAIIGDEALREETVESLSAILRNQPHWSDFPLLIMTSGGEETDGSRRGLRLLEPLGNVTLLERPFRIATLVSTVRAMLRARRHQYQIRDHLKDQKVAEEERRIILDREQRARKTAELLNRIGPIVSAELDPQKLTQKVTDLATQLTGAEFGAFFHNLVNDEGESYMLYTLSGVPREAFSRFPMPRNTAIFGPTFHNRGMVRSDDITKDPRYGKNAPYHGMPEGHLPVRSYLAASVVSRSGDVLGGLFFGHSLVGVFSEDHESIVKGIAAQAAIALDNARLFAESRQAQEAVQRSNYELRQANLELEQFAYSASHDLQEPLRMVGIYTQMLKKKYEGRLDAHADEYINYTIEGATRMEQLIRDLLLYTRSTALKERPEAAIDASAVLNRALGNLRAVIEESGTVIEQHALPPIQMHAVHLQQLFQNLIGNALKYRSEAPPRIAIQAERKPDAWLFSVADNGIGIDKPYAEHIFGIFKRLHHTGEYSGTGIGLAICKKIVESYGGRIWVDSELGKGATFFFSIPDKRQT